MCFLNFILSLLPGILWMYYVYRSDKFEPEPIKTVIMVFFCGFVIFIPTMLIEIGIKDLFGFTGRISSIFEAVGTAYFVTGLVEEFMKFGVVLFAVYYAKEFDEPVDGIVYSSAAALGFASLENFMYMNQYGTQVILLRGPLSTLGHILFSSMWGYGLARGKNHPKIARRLAITGLLFAALAHGTFNFILMSPIIFGYNIGMLIAFFILPFTYGLWVLLRIRIKKSESISPYNPDAEEDDYNVFDDMNDIA